MTNLIEDPNPLSRGNTLSDQVTEVLRANIVNAVWPVGAVLPSEASLAQEMHVSRTVVREAVSRLKAEGLLTSQQGRGAQVASDRPQMGFAIRKQEVESIRNLKKILELRCGVEIEAAALAAERATDSAKHEVLTAAQSFSETSGPAAQQVEEGVAADLRFHRAVNAATANDYYLGLFNYLGASLRETMLAGRLKAIERGGESRQAVQEHLDVANAIAEGDPELAREMMRLHLERSASRLLGNLTGECT